MQCETFHQREAPTKFQAIASRVALVAALVPLSGCGLSLRHSPNDPKFRYNTTTNPLDKALWDSRSSENAVEQVGHALENIAAHHRQAPTFRKKLEEYGALCRLENAQVRCTFGKAHVSDIPVPLPIIGEIFSGARREIHQDVTVTAQEEQPERLRFEVCIDHYEVSDRRKPAEKKRAFQDCRVFAVPSAPEPRRR